MTQKENATQPATGITLNPDGFLTFKERPLVRSGDTIYYGDMAEPFVVELHILSKTEFKGMQIADKVAIKLMNTDLTAPPAQLILKKGEKETLYEALDVASIWLTRALEDHKNEK